VQAAADANREFMEQKQSGENDSRDGFEGEIAGWLAEQEALETSNLQQQILSNQKVHLQMDKGTGAVRKGSRQASRSVAYRRIGKSSG
jgi:hypothetical protein